MLTQNHHFHPEYVKKVQNPNRLWVPIVWDLDCVNLTFKLSYNQYAFLAVNVLSHLMCVSLRYFICSTKLWPDTGQIFAAEFCVAIDNIVNSFEDNDVHFIYVITIINVE